jgi:hypothetical protein
MCMSKYFVPCLKFSVRLFISTEVKKLSGLWLHRCYFLRDDQLLLLLIFHVCENHVYKM